MLTLTHSGIKHKFLNTTRRVVLVNTVGFALDTDGRASHMDWPKSTEVTFYQDHPDTFSIGVGSGHQLTYRIEPTETGLL